MGTPDVSDKSKAASEVQVGELLEELQPDHPALRRLAARRSVGGKGVEGAITSYDRMHHRHNRS